MKNKVKLFTQFLSILLLAILLANCSSNLDFNYAANKIANTFSCDVRVSKNFSVDTDGKKTSLILELDSVDIIDENNYPMNKVASVSAKLLVAESKPENIGNASEVIVKISSKNQKSEFKYNISDLNKVDTFINVVRAYLSKIKEKKYDEMINYVDTTVISTENHLKIVNNIRIKDSAEVNDENIIVTGFDFNPEVKNVEIPLIAVWAEMSSEKRNNYFRFYLNNDGNPVKIMGMSLNQ